MKSSVMIYVDSDLVEATTKLNINRSAICNEALRLATLPKGETQTEDNAIGNYLKYKVEKLDAIASLKKLAVAKQRYPHNRKIAEDWYLEIRQFATKYKLNLNEALAEVGQ